MKWYVWYLSVIVRGGNLNLKSLMSFEFSIYKRIRNIFSARGTNEEVVRRIGYRMKLINNQNIRTATYISYSQPIDQCKMLQNKIQGII